MHDPSFMALALIVSMKMTQMQKLEKSQWTVKSRSRLKIERHRVDLNSSRCKHDPSFMALALIISGENDLNTKKFSRRRRKSNTCVDSALQARQNYNLK